jgi:site-specific recombinase XerD
MLDNQLDSVQKEFIKYLASLGISPKSHKNYRSDLSHFTSWLILKIRSFGSYINNLSEAVPFLSTNLAGEYKDFMTQNSVSPKTANRRLSTLRHLSKFLLQSQLIDSSFMDGVVNISQIRGSKNSLHPLINGFKAYLEAEKVSPNTIKNYLSDIRQFSAWLEKNNNA